MTEKMVKTSLAAGSMFLFLGVLIGAFGAHGLENIVTTTKLATFETGVRYQFYHGFGLILIALISEHFKIVLTKVFWSFTIGILFFSFNCYLYVLTDVKTFAMLVPLGGAAFLIGWLNLFIQCLRIQK